jgi:ABC-type sugar transport system permease subunit
MVFSILARKEVAAVQQNVRVAEGDRPQAGTDNLSRNRRNSGKSWYRWWRRVGVPYLFLSPFLLLFVAFFLVTLGYALGISFFVDRLIGGPIFVGSQNYLQVLQDSAFWEGVRRMGLFMVVQVPVMLGLALLFALLLDSGAS